MKEFGVKVKGGRNDVEIGLKVLPDIKFGNVETTPDDKVAFLNLNF